MYKNQINENTAQSYQLAGLFSLTIRLVIGWTYFSAFWRRLFLANKLDPETAGYIGEKFNHFLPNALGIKPLIEYLVTHPEALWWSMVSFTIIEGIVGLLLMLGLFTRLMSIGVFGLAMGILLGAGWIGTTCLDEWQIGVLGIAAGFSIFLTGSGTYSLDHWISKNYGHIAEKKWFRWAASGVMPLKTVHLNKFVLIGSIAIFSLTLFTNQYFHGGVWGTLHNKSVKPKIELSDAHINDGKLTFQVYRVEGVDVYGSFLIGIDVKDSNGNTVLEMDGEDLSQFTPSNIDNAYVAKVKAGSHSLVIPLGSKAVLTLESKTLVDIDKGNYTLTLTDISGITWHSDIEI